MPSGAAEPPSPADAAFFDDQHEFVSRRVEEYARKLDEFFGDPNRDYDSTGSTLKLRGRATFFEGGVTESRGDVRANVSLPNTENRLKLVIERGLEAATETAAERDIKDVTGSDQVAAPGAQQDDSYYLGLKLKAEEVFGVTLSAEAGAKFGRPVDPYVRLRAFRDFVFSQWAIRLSETPLWKRSEGSSAASEIGVQRPLTEAWQLRFISKATWRSTTEYFDLAQIGSVYYTPDARIAYNFELGAFAPSDRSLNQDVYSVTLRVRRRIYRDWLYLELIPQILYQEVNGFGADRSFTLQLEALFGDRYLSR